MKQGIDYNKEMRYDPIEGTTDDRLLTVKEVCELLKVSKAYIYWLTHQKRIPYIKMQGHLRFRQSNIDSWLKEQNEKWH